MVDVDPFYLLAALIFCGAVYLVVVGDPQLEQAHDTKKTK